MQLQSEDALRLLEGKDLLGIGTAADALRRELHPEDVVTYRLAGPVGLSFAEAVRDAALHGDNDVLLTQIADDLPRSGTALLEALAAQRRTYHAIRFHHLPLNLLLAADVVSIADLRNAGVRSLVMNISSDIRPASSLPDASSLLSAARAADIDTDAILTIGQGESMAERIHALASLRALQAETHAIHSLSVRVHHSTAPEARREEDATAVDYLKTLAVTRLFVDTVEHLQADWSVMGPKVLELALHFGANDAGFIPRSQRGPEPSHHGGEAELRRIIRDAGFRPVERDMSFRQSTLR